MTQTWPQLTGAEFLDVLRRNGWSILVVGEQYWAAQQRGAVQVRLRNITPETTMPPYLVEEWAEKFGLTLANF